MRAWPGARKDPKEALPASLFWQSFRDHLCPPTPQGGACAPSQEYLQPLAYQNAPVPTQPAPVGESWRDRRVDNVMANLQVQCTIPAAGGQSQIYPTVALDFYGNGHWVLIPLCTKGIGDAEQGRILHLSCFVLQCRRRHDVRHHMWSLKYKIFWRNEGWHQPYWSRNGLNGVGLWQK